ncbi:hypothetical protein DL89DRAFT_259046 [Linderina pennispora]|uniref:Uncharacterized protein n=1 Tax=Linderina pennispora TaxID=61395 RepID=A0A1Y1W330_9FUNG|nr:uncharacterized protein DL89DRAFT_259046 [Linderina pennispora]ORX67792.1 hypothetical protein DL89DRAFT_259046 [Linderina pennispora]
MLNIYCNPRDLLDKAPYNPESKRILHGVNEECLSQMSKLLNALAQTIMDLILYRLLYRCVTGKVHAAFQATLQEVFFAATKAKLPCITAAIWESMQLKTTSVSMLLHIVPTEGAIIQWYALSESFTATVRMNPKGCSWVTIALAKVD